MVTQKLPIMRAFCIDQTMDEWTLADRNALREQIVKDWLRVTQHDDDLEDVLEYIESYDLTEELLDVSPFDEPMSELERLAFQIKSVEQGFHSSRAGQLMIVASTQPFLDMLFEDIERYGEIERYQGCIDLLNALNTNELDVLIEVIDEYWKTRAFLTVAQNHVTLTHELLERGKRFSINDLDDARLGIDIYKKCMDICDSGFSALLNLKYVAEGADPRRKDFISMRFSAARNSLESHEAFDPLVDAVDADLRNAISHGDIWVDNVENTIETNNPDKSYSLEEFDEAVSVAIPLARFVATLPTVIRARWAAEKSGFSKHARDRLID